MTDNDIIKALECCVNKHEWFVSYCDGDGNKHHITIKDILDLINRQKAEIEELKIGAGLRNNRKYYRKFVDEVFQKEKGNDLLYPDFDYIYQLYFEQKAEIESLKNELDLRPPISASYLFKMADLDEMITRVVSVEGEFTAQIRAEAIKEFAERLKGAKQYSIERHENIVPVAVIDWIVKEMVGDV